MSPHSDGKDPFPHVPHRPRAHDDLYRLECMSLIDKAHFLLCSDFTPVEHTSGEALAREGGPMERGLRTLILQQGRSILSKVEPWHWY
jgi:hypothetical protein